ncbi:MAG: glycoside hydrolase family 66 protein [Paenibacillaceae bacterium]
MLIKLIFIGQHIHLKNLDDLREERKGFIFGQWIFVGHHLGYCWQLACRCGCPCPAGFGVVYIEVWKPYDKYHHIQQIVFWAKYMSRGKNVILAAYLEPFKDEAQESRERANFSALLLTAVIAANGGYHLLLGEDNAVLTQGYYVVVKEIFIASTDSSMGRPRELSYEIIAGSKGMALKVTIPYLHVWDLLDVELEL